MKSDSTRPGATHSLPMNLVVFALLVALGAVGRHLALDLWPNFTPIAAVSVFAGFYFRHLLVAFAVPFMAMAISNAWLPAYDSMWIGVVVYAAFFLPVLLPRLITSLPRLGQAALVSLVPAVVFFLVSNFAVWATDTMYAPTTAGLLECYTYALPFFRTMLAGDICYLGLTFGTYALIQHLARETQVVDSASLAK